MSREIAFIAVLMTSWPVVAAPSVEGTCDGLSIGYLNEIKNPRAQNRRIRLLIGQINAGLPRDIIPPTFEVRLSTAIDRSAMQAYSSSVIDGPYISVPSRFFNHLSDGEGAIRMSLRDSDSIIAHEYGHTVFHTALEAREVGQFSKLERNLATLVEEITSVSKKIEDFATRSLAKAHAILDRDHGGVWSRYLQVKDAELAKWAERSSVLYRDIDPDTWRPIPGRDNGPEIERLTSEYNKLEEQGRVLEAECARLLAPIQEQLRNDPTIIALTQELEKKDHAAVSEMSEKYHVLLNYHELFADLIAVLNRQDPTVLARVMKTSDGELNKSRNFVSTVSAQDWVAQECHDFYAPVRAFIGASILPKTYSHVENKKIINGVLEVIFDELQLISANKIDVRTLSVGERNQLLIERLAVKFGISLL